VNRSCTLNSRNETWYPTKADHLRHKSECKVDCVVATVHRINDSGRSYTQDNCILLVKCADWPWIRRVQYTSRYVKLPRYRNAVAKGERCITSRLNLDLDNRWWVVSVTPRPRFTPGKGPPSVHWIGGWVGPRAGLHTEARGKILCLCQGPIPGRLVRHHTGWLRQLCTTHYMRELLLRRAGLHGGKVSKLCLGYTCFQYEPKHRLPSFTVA
jgi:hypothetical protein